MEGTKKRSNAQQEQMSKLDHQFGEAESKSTDVFRAWCVFCLEDGGPGDYFRRLECGHYFHESCFEKWQGFKSFCPCNQGIGHTYRIQIV